MLLVQQYIEHLQVRRRKVHLAELQLQQIGAVGAHRQLVAKGGRVIALRLVQLLVGVLLDATDAHQILAVVGGDADAMVHQRVALVVDAVLVDVIVAARIDGVHHLVGVDGCRPPQRRGGNGGGDQQQLLNRLHLMCGVCVRASRPALNKST